MTAKPRRKTSQAPTGRNNSAQGNALGDAIPEDQSPEPERSGDRSPTGDRAAVNEVNQRARHLPEGWRWVTLKEIANIAGGVTKGQKRRPNEVIRKVPYLRVANVQRGYLDLSEVKEIEASESEIEALQLQPGDILFNEGGDRDKLGRGWIWNGELPECVHQNHVFRARLKNTEDQPKFISFYGNSEGQRYFMEQGKQTTNLASINLTKLGALPIPLPPPDDQCRIVAEIEKQFTRLEAGVAALRRVQANLKRYRAAVLKAACEGRLVPTEAELSRSGVPPLNPDSTAKPASSKAGSKVSPSPKRQDAASTFESGQQLLARILTERRQNWQGRGKYKEPASLSASGYEPESLPEGWGRSSIAQVAFLDVGFAFKSAEFEKSGIRLLRGENLEPGRMRWADTRYWPESKLPDVEHLLIREGEIVLAMDRPLISSGLKIARARKHDLPCLLVQRMARLRPVVESMTPFLFMVMNTQGFIKHLLGGQTGTQLPHISGEGIQSFDFPLPPLAEQIRIVAEVERRLSVVEELEAVVTTNLQRATRLRQAVLQKAFNGELVSVEVPKAAQIQAPALTLLPAPAGHKPPNRHFARALLSAEIVHRLHGEPTFGRTKHQKIFHLCEHIARIGEIGGQYHREAAGPLDNKLIYANEAELKKQQWYAEVKRDSYGHAYQALPKAGAHRPYVERYWPEKLPIIDKLIELMRDWKTERCEIFCTAYAAWNDLLIQGQEPTNEAILHEILDCWNESKKRITKERWLNAIHWMKKEGWAPQGFGKPTKRLK